MITIIAVCTKRTFLLPPFCVVGMGIQHFLFLFSNLFVCSNLPKTHDNKAHVCLIKFLHLLLDTTHVFHHNYSFLSHFLKELTTKIVLGGLYNSF